MSRRIFISYSHRDEAIVNGLTAVLDDIGVLYFLDRKDINWGASITRKVQSGLAYSSAVLVVISPASQKSQWVPYEVGYASAVGIEVLPFLTHPDTEVPLYMRELNAISSLSQFKAHWTKHRPPPSPMERDLLNGDGKFEWQWAGQNWHGELSFTTNRSGQVRTTIQVQKVSKTEETHTTQTVQRGPIVLRSSGRKSGTVSVSEEVLLLDDLVVKKNEFPAVSVDHDHMLESFTSCRETTQILRAMLRRVPAFAGRVTYREAETGIEREGDMVLVKYKSTVAL